MDLQSLPSYEISISVSTNESDSFDDTALAAIGGLDTAMGELATAIGLLVAIGAVNFRFGKSGGGNARTSIELRL